MPIALERLDTNEPTLWSSYWGGTNPRTSDPIDDSETALRVSEAADPVNVWTRQRVEGDLFNRDLRLEIGLEKLNNFIGNVGVVSLNTPSVRLPVNESISLGRLSQVAGVAAWVYIGVGVTSTDAAQIELYNVTTSTSVYADSVSGFKRGANATPSPLTSGNEYEIRVKNASAAPIVVSAWALAVPNV